MEAKDIEFKKYCHSCWSCIPKNQTPMFIRYSDDDGNPRLVARPKTDERYCKNHDKWVDAHGVCDDYGRVRGCWSNGNTPCAYCGAEDPDEGDCNSIIPDRLCVDKNPRVCMTCYRDLDLNAEIWRKESKMRFDVYGEQMQYKYSTLNRCGYCCSYKYTKQYSIYNFVVWRYLDWRTNASKATREKFEVLDSIPKFQCGRCWIGTKKMLNAWGDVLKTNRVLNNLKEEIRNARKAQHHGRPTIIFGRDDVGGTQQRSQLG